ncbi:MAG: TolC family protein, partial [Candidatus Hydrogenedentes bacterium]|nr:TolC family protein [Candidatus Hydrogenedentota bacterium]
RDVLYELRDFTRFGKTFAVRIASDYYRILRERDAVRNNYRGLQSFRLNLDRERAFADEGLSTPAAVGRLEQAELSRETTWIGSVRRYRQSLDNFKIMLGLPTDVPLILDDSELERLIGDGIRHPKFTNDYAVELGLTRRLDLETTRDRVEDAGRRIQVTASALKPGLDLILTSSLDSKDGNRVFSPDFDATQWSAGLDLDLPLNRKAERNGYRSALISYERSIRDLALLGDQITFEIRDAWRALEQAKRTYEINLVGLELNRRRVEEQDLRAELGLGNVLDQVDAQNDLTNAQNDLTGQLIAHTVARLELWRDMGTLSVQDDGQWEEGFDVDEK